MTENSQARLPQTLKLPSLVIFGLAYLTPLIVLGIFGVIASTTQGASSGAYLIALLAMLFTANSYSRLAGIYPEAGSAYTYVRKILGNRIGFLVGWLTLLDYLFLPMVIWLIGGAYLNAQFPDIPTALWIILFVLITTALNIIGIKVADKVNLILMAFQILVLVIFVVLTCLTLAGASQNLLSLAPFTGGSNSNFALITAGAAIAAYSFLGFDAVTTLAEETHEAEKTVPRAIFFVALIGGAIFIVVSYFGQLVHPGGIFENVDSAGFEIAKTVGGNLFASIFVAALIIAQFTSGIAAQAAGSRLLFAMGRDKMLPSKIFGFLSRRTQTPVYSIITIGLVGALAVFLDLTTSTSFINFGAFVSFTMVNISLILLWAQSKKNAGHQGRLVRDLVAPTIGALVIVYLLLQLDGAAIRLGLIWLGLGLLLLAVKTRFFTHNPPEFLAE
ncbi:APC family permease [Rothia sp. P4278]|uniref:APC family permease n=1 Tax=unclassified Rothia (in: high G+C Gram-positive bacteria) TaxID=2689056 RepID=UPI003ACD0A2C